MGKGKQRKAAKSYEEQQKATTDIGAGNNQNRQEKAKMSNKRQKVPKWKPGLSQKPKQANAFCCSVWLFVARFGFLWMFQFEHRIARCGVLLVAKTKMSNKWKKCPNGNQV